MACISWSPFAVEQGVDAGIDALGLGTAAALPVASRDAVVRAKQADDQVIAALVESKIRSVIPPLESISPAESIVRAVVVDECCLNVAPNL